MNRLAILAVAACHGAAPSTPKVSGVAAPTTLDPVAIDAWIASELADRGIVGGSLVIVHDGATVLAKGYGTRVTGKREPIDADTPFAIGSVSKQLTCAAVMLMVEDGKLKLSDPVSKWYPALVRASDITLDDLGAHISGYRDYYPLDYKDARMSRPIAPDELLSTYAGQPLDFEPRNRRSYSNTGFVLLARVVEKVSGMPFAQLLDQRIFKPLKMTHTSASGPPPGAASGHDAFLLGPAESTVPEAAGWLFGAGSVYASASDLARWDLAFSNGEILSDASRDAMTRIHHTSDGREVPYGCGLAIRVDRGERVLSHTGEVEGFLAYNAFVPRMRSAVILLVNDLHANVGDLQDKLVQLVLARPDEIPAIPGPTADNLARTLVLQLQSGTLDRSLLGDDLAAYFDPARIAEAAGRIRALGKLQKVKLQTRRERGGMEQAEIDLVFDKRTLHATMFRSRIGKVHQFQLAP